MNIYQESESYFRSILNTKDEEYLEILLNEASEFIDSLRIERLLYVERKSVRKLNSLINVTRKGV